MDKKTLRMSLSWEEIDKLSRALAYNNDEEIGEILDQHCGWGSEIYYLDINMWHVLKDRLQDYVDKNLMKRDNQLAYEEWFNTHSEIIKESLKK